jgi:hypothetical protein
MSNFQNPTVPPTGGRICRTRARSGANAPVSLAGSAGAGEIEGRRGLKIGREIGAELIEVATSYEVATS